MPAGVVPFRQFVLKVCTRCDLACDHCYVYEHADQSWQIKPKVISDETVVAAAGRIASHARSHGLPEVRVILHGGEPLLVGKSRLARICAQLRERFGHSGFRHGADQPNEVRAHDRDSHTAIPMRPANASDIKYMVIPASIVS